MKNLDIDAVVAQIERGLTNSPTGMAAVVPSTKKLAQAEIDISGELKKRASEYIERMYDRSHSGTVKLDGLDAEVLTREERHRQIGRILGVTKMAALAGVAAELRSIAATADSAGLRKQAADLRFAAEQLEFGFGDAASTAVETGIGAGLTGAAAKVKGAFSALATRGKALATTIANMSPAQAAALTKAAPVAARLTGGAVAAFSVGWIIGRALDSWFGLYDRFIKQFEPGHFGPAMEGLTDRIEKAQKSEDPADWDRVYVYAKVLLSDKELPEDNRKFVSGFVTLLDNALQRTESGMREAEKFLAGDDDERGRPVYTTYFANKMAELWSKMQKDFAFYEQHNSDPLVAAEVSKMAADKNMKFLYRWGRKQISTEQALAVFKRGGVSDERAAARMNYVLTGLDKSLSEMRVRIDGILKDSGVEIDMDMDFGAEELA